MATPTYDLIEGFTLTSSATTVSFTNITQNYRDLILVTRAFSTTANNYGGALVIELNSDSGTNYKYIYQRGNASTVASSSGSGITNIFVNYLSNNDYHGVAIHHFMDYSATDKYKNVLARTDNSGGTNQVRQQLYSWDSTSAITRIDVNSSGGTMASGSKLFLYGVVA